MNRIIRLFLLILLPFIVAWAGFYMLWYGFFGTWFPLTLGSRAAARALVATLSFFPALLAPLTTIEVYWRINKDKREKAQQEALKKHKPFSIPEPEEIIEQFKKKKRQK